MNTSIFENILQGDSAYQQLEDIIIMSIPDSHHGLAPRSMALFLLWSEMIDREWDE